MSFEDHADRPVIPPKVLLAAGLMVFASIAGAAWARLTDNTVATAPDVPAVRMVELSFVDHPDGSVSVLDGEREVALLEGVDDGFIRGVLRAVARQRRLSEAAGSRAPVRIVHWSDGRLSVEDPVSGAKVELNAFGPDNVQAFRRLLDAVPTREGTATVTLAGLEENGA